MDGNKTLSLEIRLQKLVFVMLVVPRNVDERHSECTREPLHILEEGVHIRLVFQDHPLGNSVRAVMEFGEKAIS